MIDRMWPTGSVHNWRETSGAPGGPIGPAMTTLRSVVAPLASTVRSAGIVYIVVQVVIWHSFYTADLWRLAGPAVAVAWAAIVVVRLRRRWPSPFLAGVDSAVYVALALGAQGCVPPQVRDDMFGWLVVSMSGQLIVPAWYAPGVLSALLTLIMPTAYLVGAARLPVTDSRTMTGAAVILIVIGLVHILARRVLYRRAAAADGTVAEAAASAGEQYAILSRNIERREHERLLHDTVLNTLTALARASADDLAEVVSRCRGDVALIEDALGDRDDLAAGAGRAAGDLVGQVRAVVADLRGRGLTVHLDIDDEGAPVVPARVAAAIANATREALSNVAAHAGTAEAWVLVRLTAAAGRCRRPRPPAGDRARPRRRLRPRPGRPGQARPPAVHRASAPPTAAAQASIRSAPGQGTEVSLVLACLRAPRDRAGSRARPGEPARGRQGTVSPHPVSPHPVSPHPVSPQAVSPQAVSPQAVTRDIAQAGLMRMVGTIAVFPPCLAIIQVLATAHNYRQPGVAIVVWLAVLAAAAWLVPRLQAGGLSAGETAAAIAIAIAAVALVALARQAHATPGSVDLAVLGTVWLLVLVVVSRSALVWVPAALLVFAVHSALLVRAEGLNRADPVRDSRWPATSARPS